MTGPDQFNFCEVPGSGVSASVGFADRHFPHFWFHKNPSTPTRLPFSSAALAQEWGNLSAYSKASGRLGKAGLLMRMSDVRRLKSASDTSVCRVFEHKQNVFQSQTDCGEIRGLNFQGPVSDGLFRSGEPGFHAAERRGDGRIG